MKPVGEFLISQMPAPRPTGQELAQPCIARNAASENEQVARLLGSRRVYLLALNVWGMKWLPSHAGLTRGSCTDFVFLQMQFQRAIGVSKPGLFEHADVQLLIAQVEPMARQLVDSGQLDKVILEQIPE